MGCGTHRYSNEWGRTGTPGLWGTELGQQLRTWYAWVIALYLQVISSLLKARMVHEIVARYATNGRPLIWADANNGSMLLDPLVARWG